MENNANSQIHESEGSLNFTVEDLKNQVSADICEYIEDFQDQRKGLKALSSLSGVHEKTIKRLVEKENKAGYQTLLKIYRALFRTNNDGEIIKLSAPVISHFLRLSSPKFIQADTNFFVDIDHEITKNPIFCELYFLSASGTLTKEWVGFHYGQYGLKIFQEMIDKKIVAKVSENQYAKSINRASLKPNTIKKSALHLIERFFKISNSDNQYANYATFHVADIDPETYKKWIDIDEKAYQEKMNLLKEVKSGGIKAFLFSAIDTLTENNDQKLH